MQASVKHQVDLVKLRCENNKLQAALQKAVDDKECTHIQVVYHYHYYGQYYHNTVTFIRVTETLYSHAGHRVFKSRLKVLRSSADLQLYDSEFQTDANAKRFRR